MLRSGRAVVLVVVLSVAPAAALADGWRVTVRNPGHELGETPVLTEVPSALGVGPVELVPESGTPGDPVPGHVFVDQNKKYLGVVLPKVAADAASSYSLRTATKPATAVRIERAGENDVVRLGDSLFTVYHRDEPSKPYFFPLIGPTGAPYTRSYPMIKNIPGEARDHNHQRSMWFTHGNINGVDFWASDPLNGKKANYGSIREVGRHDVGGPFAGLIRTRNDWLDHDGGKVLSDVRVVRFYATTGARVLDFDVKLTAAEKPATFNDTKEGMFGLRVASSMDVDRKAGGRITNAEGVHDAAAWGKASPWVDYTGPVAGKTVGIAILNHPSSFRYPTTWHVRTYGLFAANPFGWHDFGLGKSGAYTLEPGKSIAFRYRVILHEGDTAAADIAGKFRAYAEPPVVEVTARTN